MAWDFNYGSTLSCSYINSLALLRQGAWILFVVLPPGLLLNRMFFPFLMFELISYQLGFGLPNSLVLHLFTQARCTLNCWTLWLYWLAPVLFDAFFIHLVYIQFVFYFNSIFFVASAFVVFKFLFRFFFIFLYTSFVTLFRRILIWLHIFLGPMVEEIFP